MAETVSTEINTNYIPQYMVEDDGQVKAEYLTIAAQISEGVSTLVADLPPVERAMFIVLLTSLFALTTEEGLIAATDGAIDIDGDGTLTYDELAAQIYELEEIATFIAELFRVAGGFNDLMAMLVEIAMLIETDAVECRLRARDDSTQSAYRQAKKLRKQGRRAFKTALESMLIQLAVAVVTLVITVFSICNAAKQINNSRAAKENYHASLDNEISSNSSEGVSKNDVKNYDQNALEKTAHKGQSQQLKAQGDIKQMEARINETYGNVIQQIATQIKTIGDILTQWRSGEGQKDLKMLEGEEVEASAEANYFKNEQDIYQGFERNFYDAVAKMIQTADKILEQIVAQWDMLMRAPS